MAITRCPNSFGGYDFSFSRLIPAVARGTTQSEVPTPPVKRQVQARFSVHRRCADAQLLVAQQLSANPALYGEAFNFSYGEHIEVRDIVQRICQLLDAPHDPVMNENSTAEIPEICLSSDKARQSLGWKPSCDFQAGLERNVKWYRQYFSRHQAIPMAGSEEAMTQLNPLF